jgi:hypothetical protein
MMIRIAHLKADTRKPLTYLGILLVLLAWRLPWSAVKPQQSSVATRSP